MNALKAVSGTVHIATIWAYAIKDEMGGGFRGVFYDRRASARDSSDRLDTLAAAKAWAQTKAHEHCEALNLGYRLAPLRKSGEYYANVWVRSDEFNALINQ